MFGGDEGHLFRQQTEHGPSLDLDDQHARNLAQAIAGILVELQATRCALQDREAELATAVPVIVRGNDGADFNHRLQAILRGIVEGLRGRAAALYLLDDTTSQLKLRSHWGLPSLRFLEPARALRGAVADLEALTGHAVVLEDAQLLAHWNVPEQFGSAICVPVASPDTLLGTLWFFSDAVREYTSQETQLLEIVAGRLAVELERRVLVQQAAQNAQHRDQFEEFLAWHRERADQVPPVIEGWQVASATVREGAICGDFCAWHLGMHDQLRLATSSLAGSAARSTLSATLYQGAVQATMRQTTSPFVILQTLNDILWSSAPGGEGASTFVATLDPASGQLEYATAGSTDAYILRPHGWEPIAVDGVPLGHEPDWDGAAQDQEIHPGDVLLVISDRHMSHQNQNLEFDSTSLAETLLRHVHLSARDLADLAVQLITRWCPDPWARSILVVKRVEGPAIRRP
jgi:serine phosphatase RsbU (regulator of sigma subunit)